MRVTPLSHSNTSSFAVLQWLNETKGKTSLLMRVTPLSHSNTSSLVVLQWLNRRFRCGCNAVRRSRHPYACLWWGGVQGTHMLVYGGEAYKAPICLFVVGRRTRHPYACLWSRWRPWRASTGPPTGAGRRASKGVYWATCGAGRQVSKGFYRAYTPRR